MPQTKKYFHDRVVLSLLGVDFFLAFLNSLLVFIRLGNGQTNGGYIVQYRENLGIAGFKTGGLASVLSFVVFGLVVLAVHTVLSMQIYHVRQKVAVAILGLGALLLVVSIIISNALLVLR